MPLNNPYLVIAQSGRALAASAAKAGLQTHVIDQFADSDTQEYALSTRVVNKNRTGMCADYLNMLLDHYAGLPLAGVITGSGFENQPEVLNELEQRFKLLGNTAACVKACKDLTLFFSLLKSYGISYPEISLEPLDEYEGWLVKKVGGTGGQHVCWADANQLPENHYYQKFIAGRTLSAVFLADGKQARVIGVNETWSHDPDNNNFSYAGALTLSDLNPAIAEALDKIVAILVEQLQLVGLCGLDIVVDQRGKCHVLEVNPRPVATFELHEQGQSQSLFYAHVEACQGRLGQLLQRTDIYQGHEILYLTSHFVVPEIAWPEWVSDRPDSGRQIASGEPICTIHAAATSAGEIKLLLKQRSTRLKELFGLEKIAA